MDEIVSGGGGAPLARTPEDPDLRDYVKAGAPEGVTMQHLARPSSDAGGNRFHYVIVHVDGEKISVEVVAVDWGKGFSPYRSSRASLADPGPPPE